MTEYKTCLSCKNENCFIVYGVSQDKKKDCKEHHECFDWNKVFDCTNHNKYKEKTMFEKEAEDYANKNSGMRSLPIHEAYARGLEEGFQDGAEFGYNKGKEELTERFVL